MNDATPTDGRAPARDAGGRALPVAWKGGLIGLIAATLFVTTLMGFLFRSGFGVILDTLVGSLAGALGLTVFAGLTAAVAWVLRRIPAAIVVAGGAALGTLVAIRLLDDALAGRSLWPEEIYYRSLVPFVALHAALGGAVWVVLRGRPRTAARRALLTSVIATVVIADVVAVAWLAREGSLPAAAARAVLDATGVAPLDVANPADPGPYAVRTTAYGSGENRRRAIFGTDVALRTESVDASPLLEGWKGFKARMRELYWGFGIDRYPVNGIVWYPEGVGPFPLVLIAHGNHAMEEFSDPGYAYLGELLASRGFITVSVDENLTNATWSGDFRGAEMPARAWLLLKHLKQWREWNRTAGNPFTAKVNMDDIALIGHSRGGEAVAMAAVFNRLPRFPDDATIALDTGFAIKAVIGIAPTDHRYSRRMAAENVSYLTLHGAYDTDVSNFYGMRQYDRVRFTDDRYRFKAALYIQRANHGQFNTVWGREDVSPPRGWLLNVRPLISGADQRRIAETFIAGFLEATLNDRLEYVPMFRDPRTAAAWLPDVGYLHRFEDSSFRPLASFDDDLDVTTATIPGGRIRTANLAVWRETPLPFREDEDNQRNSGVYVGWSAGAAGDSAVYAIVVPESGRAPPPNGRLVFSLSATDEKPPAGDAGRDRPPDTEPAPAVAVEVVDGSGAVARLPLARFGPISTPFYTPLLLKTEGLSRRRYGKPWEPVLNSYEIPLAAFAAENPQADLARISEIRFTFSRERDGVVILDDVGYRS